MKRIGRVLAALGMILTLTAVTVVGVLAWQVNRYGSEDLAQPADAIVVLGARVNADGSASSDLISRTFHAVDLYHAGLAPVVICAGGAAGDRLAAGAVSCRFAVQELGVPVPRAYVATEADAFSTEEEALAVADLMRRNGWRSAILVSHPLHLYRAQWLFGRQGLEVFTSPTNTELARIAPPVRAWYTLREAGGVLLTAIAARPLVDRLETWLSQVVYGA